MAALAFSPGGGRIVEAGYDRAARVWDARTERRLLRLSGHQGFVNAAAFSPDGRRVVTGGADGTSRVWYSEPATPPPP